MRFPPQAEAGGFARKLLMKHYLDIKLLPDLEFSEQTLLNALFAKFHRAMNKVAQGQVAISFPEVKNNCLGGKLRLHGKAEALNTLMAENWLHGMKDYCEFSIVKEAPANCKNRTVKRVQSKSAHNKRKRSIAKGWLTESEALEQITSENQKLLTLPWIEAKSLSNGNRMRVFVEHGPLLSEPKQGKINSYGLSAQATVPWF